MPYGFIYIAKNLINGKCYVGQTTQPSERRFDQHRRRLKSSHCKALSAAIRRYGPDAFEFSVICEAETKDALDAAEIKAIADYHSLAPHGYNIKSGGSFGKHSEQSREAISIGNTGKRRSPSQREDMSMRMLGKSPSPETCAKISATLKRAAGPPSEANQAVLIAANTGRVPTLESRLLMSRNRSGIPMADETKQLLRDINLGKQHSNETKAKMSASQIARWATRKQARAAP